MPKGRPVYKLTKELRQQLIECCAEHYVADPIGGIRQAINNGIQDALPPEKQQPYPKAVQSWQWLRKAVDARAMQLRVEEVRVPIPVTRELPDIKAFTTNELLNELMSRMLSMAQERMEAGIRDAIRSQLASMVLPQMATPTPPVPPKPKRLKIAVVGLLKRQEREIREEFEPIFDLKFLTTDVGAFRNGALTYQDYIFSTRFLSHKHTDQIARMGREHIKVNGTTALKEKLMEIYVYHKPTE